MALAMALAGILSYSFVSAGWRFVAMAVALFALAADRRTATKQVRPLALGAALGAMIAALVGLVDPASRAELGLAGLPAMDVAILIFATTACGVSIIAGVTGSSKLFQDVPHRLTQLQLLLMTIALVAARITSDSEAGERILDPLALAAVVIPSLFGAYVGHHAGHALAQFWQRRHLLHADRARRA